jgi:hypothetical protein
MFAQLSSPWWIFALCGIAAILSRIVAISTVVCGVLVTVHVLELRSLASWTSRD